MIKLKDKKGAITMVTLITVLFLVSFLMSSYIIVSNKVKTQKEMLNETRSIYESKVTMEEIYNSYFSNDNVIPIYTVNQLLSIGNNEKINIDGKIYTFSSDKAYVLSNNLEFSAIDLGLESDWIPTYNSGNFEWNGNTIKVTTLSGNVITYSGNTITGYPVTLANSMESTLVDYKIYGNSIQSGTPTPASPITIESVGDETINLFNSNQELIKIGTYLGIDTTGIDTNYALQIKLKEGKEVPEGVYFGFVYYKTETSAASAKWLISSGSLNEKYGDGTTYGLTTFNPSEYYKTGICCYSGTQEKWDEIMDAFDIFWIEGTYSLNTLPEYEPYGKYKIPVKVSLSSGEEKTFNIYLDEPLRKIGDYADYIDFANQQIVRYVEVLDDTGTLTIEESYQGLETPEIESIELPTISTYSGINTITVDTDVQPSNMSITYNTK